jgi:hypothetical protein
MIDNQIVLYQGGKEKPLDVLLRLASTAQLCRSADGRVHARVKVGDRQEMYALSSVSFVEWLTDGYFAACGQPPSVRAIQRVIGVLKARARFGDGTPSVFVRVGHDRGADDSAYYLDLGDPTGRAIWICADGWCVVDKPDVHFRRPEGLLPLPVPSTNGSIELLRPYTNVTDADFRLVVAWLTAALRPVGPYPILVLYGEQGSAKTTLARILRLLIDPQACPLLDCPRTTRDLMVTAVNGWLLAFDNISSIDSLSDSLCRLVTGGGFAARTLYSNDERSFIYAQRPIILNGIEEFVRRGDLIDRSVFIHQPVIEPESRRAEREFWKAFRADYPRILGGVLDAVVGGLRELPSVQLPELPRMADYAEWGEAVGRGLGWAADTFTLTYTANRQIANNPALEDSMVGMTLLEMAPQLEKFWGGFDALLREITYFVEGKDDAIARLLSPATARKRRTATLARWPKDTRQLSKELRRVVPLLRQHGLTVEFDRSREGCSITFKYKEPPEDDDFAQFWRGTEPTQSTDRV